MTKSLLTTPQKKFLNFFSNQPLLWTNFYFSGGTALSEFYLQHRFSEDLDFFSEREINTNDLNLFLQTKKNDFGASNVQFQQSFNRQLFFIQPHQKKQELKLEFTYYPFPRLQKGLVKNNLQIDSVWDIAVNKVFTLMQQARGRDFFDLFAIYQKYNFAFQDLIKAARKKFDYPINYLQLGKNLIKISELLDDPILNQKFEKKTIENYFFQQAKLLKILKNS
jgi:predicted nucleotidyltransferase component of viral defense system